MSIHLLPDWDCVKCTARQKVARGCTEKARQKTEIEGQRLDRCPKRLFLDQPTDLSELFWYYQNYKRGLQPVDGGVLDQPALLMEQFKVIDSALATIEADEAEELRRQSNRGK